jgi:phage major head subunit gpT-like protein
MDITPSNLSAFFQNLRLDFQSSYQNAPTFYQQISTTIPSTSEQNVYGWMDFIPQLRQWVGERYVRNVVSRSFTATNLLFEDNIEVPRTKIEDDQYGLYGVRAAMLGRAAALWPDVQVANAVINGGAAASLCYDGQSFFSNAHPKDPSGELSGTQSNDLATALSGAAFATALSTGKSYVGRDGVPIGAFSSGRPILMVGPTLEKTGRDIVAANFFSPAAQYGAAAANAPSDNTFMGAASLLVNPYITSSTAWYLIDGSFPMKPFVWQLRTSPVFQSRMAESDEPVFTRDVYQWGVRARGVATYGLWWLAIRGNS